MTQFTWCFSFSIHFKITVSSKWKMTIQRHWNRLTCITYTSYTPSPIVRISAPEISTIDVKKMFLRTANSCKKFIMYTKITNGNCIINFGKFRYDINHLPSDTNRILTFFIDHATTLENVKFYEGSEIPLLKRLFANNAIKRRLIGRNNDFWVHVPTHQVEHLCLGLHNPVDIPSFQGVHTFLSKYL